MSGISPIAIAMFGASIVLQLISLAFMPLSHGYTKLLPTLGVIVCTNLTVYFFALLVARGVQLSVLIPISAALVPLGAIALGVLTNGESAPMLKMAILVFAAFLIGVASSLK
jgi:multidrug transporter EmrE-like cation transporter